MFFEEQLSHSQAPSTCHSHTANVAAFHVEMPPSDIVPPIACVVELVVKDTDSSRITDDLATQAKTLMSDAVQAMSKRAADIDADANIVLTNPGYNSGRTQGTQTNAMAATCKKCLDAKSVDELKQIIDTCTKVEAAAKDFQDVSKQTPSASKTSATPPTAPPKPPPPP